LAEFDLPSVQLAARRKKFFDKFERYRVSLISQGLVKLYCCFLLSSCYHVLLVNKDLFWLEAMQQFRLLSSHYL